MDQFTESTGNDKSSTRSIETDEDFFIAQLYEDMDKVIAERDACRRERGEERFCWIVGTLLGVFVLMSAHMPAQGVVIFGVVVVFLIDIAGKHFSVHTGVVSSVLTWLMAAKR